MSNHTPGPWSSHSEANGLHLTVRAGMSPISEMWLTGAPMDERKANARLIAAAPELLEALKECAAQLEIHMVHTEDLIAHMKAVSAIAKATGESA